MHVLLVAGVAAVSPRAGGLGWTFHQALSYDDHIETRNMYSRVSHLRIMLISVCSSVYSRNGLQWYCLYLQVSAGQPWQDCSV